MANFRRNNDYVVGLITGRTRTGTDVHGKTVTEFVPNVINKHMTLDSMQRQTPDKPIQEILVAEALVSKPFHLDVGVFSKTPREKRYLKKMKADYRAMVIKEGSTPKERMAQAEVFTLCG